MKTIPLIAKSGFLGCYILISAFLYVLISEKSGNSIISTFLFLAICLGLAALASKLFAKVN